MREAVVALIIKDGLILGISRRDDKTKFGLIGGKVDLGESLEEALLRETKEEASIIIKNCVPLYKRIEVGSGSNAEDFYTHCYYADEWEGTPQNSEEGIVRWLTVKEITSTIAAFGEYNSQTIEKFREMYPDIKLKENELCEEDSQLQKL